MIRNLTKTGKMMAIFMLMLVATLSVASCKDDKDEPKSDNSQLVGTWKALDSDGDMWLLTLNKNNTGNLSVTYTTRASITVSESFSWTTSSDSSGNKWLDIIHTSGDEILSTKSYIYILAGNKLSFGGLVFSK